MPIGAKFYDKRLEKKCMVIENDCVGHCHDDCIYLDLFLDDGCKKTPCCNSERKDGKDVYFKEL